MSFGQVALGGLFLLGSAMKSRGQQATAINEQFAYEQKAQGAFLRAQEARSEAALTGVSQRIESRRLAERIANNRASQKAAVSGSGVELGGSNLAVLGRTAQQQELDLLTMRFNYDARRSALIRNAAVLDVTGQNLLDEGFAARSAGRARSRGTLLTGFTSSLGQIASLGGMG